MKKKEILYSEIRKDFYNNFYKKVLPILQKYEPERKSRQLRAIFLTILYIVLTLLQIIIMFSSWFLKADWLITIISILLPCFVAGMLYTLKLSVVTYYNIKKEFEENIKIKIMPIICSCFEDLTWKTFCPSDIKMFNSFVIPLNDSWIYDDVLEGSYKNVKFLIVESIFKKKLIEEAAQDSTLYKVFQGVVVRINMNKKVVGHTVIKPKLNNDIVPSTYLKKTVLESPDFSKKYNVFTTDEVEARYLITTSFIDRLNNIKLSFNAKEISCAFYEGSLYISLKTNKPMFDLCSLDVPLDDENLYFQMYEEIVSIIKLIDHFKLDQKIGL